MSEAVMLSAGAFCQTGPIGDIPEAYRLSVCVRT